MSTQQLASDLRAVSHRLVRRLSAHAADPTLTPTQLGFLARLDLAGELTGADLARGEGVSPQAANVALADLVSRRLVTRRTDPDDARRRLHSLTDDGRTRIHAVRDDKTSWLARRLEELTDAERATLADAVVLLARLGETR